MSIREKNKKRNCESALFDDCIQRLQCCVIDDFFYYFFPIDFMMCMAWQQTKMTNFHNAHRLTLQIHDDKISQF